MGFPPVLEDRFLAADLLQRQFAALLVQLLKAIETVPRVATAQRAPALQAWLTLPNVSASFNRPTLFLMSFWSVVISHS